MIKQHLRQAWTMMKQQKLFTSIYIAGTALSVTMIMITFAVLYIKFAPIYPEENRDRMLIIPTIYCQEKGKEEKTGRHCSLKVAELIKRNSEQLDEICCTYSGYETFTTPVATDGNHKKYEVPAKYVDESFWKVFTFRFIDGSPFGEKEIKEKRAAAVISRSTAMQLFEATEVTGKDITILGKRFTICGVVEDATSITPLTSASIYIALGHESDRSYLSEEEKKNTLMGQYRIYATAKRTSDKNKLENEINNIIERYNADDAKYIHEAVVNTLIEQTYKDDSLKKFITEIILIVAAFLLIPALNLSNMIASRMENRMVEFGVRKSYGATNICIARQVLWENMLLTFAGGLLGLLLSIVVVSNADEWILYLFDSGESVRNYLYDMKRLGTPQLPFAMLFNVPLFVCTLLLCTMINILSAFIPLAASLRHSIVYSLNKRK